MYYFCVLMLEISLQGEQVKLLPEKAIYWPAEKALIIADLHWGKTAHFRKNGIAIPIHTQNTDEVKLANLINRFNVERLIVAGDMFHSRENNEVANFAHWREAHQQLHVDLVIGNHDILPAESYLSNKINVMDEMMDAGPFLVSHDELKEPGKFYIHGHVHPCCSIPATGRNKNLRLPCFCADNNRMILPSFGSFTGSHKVDTAGFKQVYVIADDEVLQWQ